MKPHPRIRKTVKWGGAVVTVLLVVVWIGSGWRGVRGHIAGEYGFGVMRGRIMIDHHPAYLAVQIPLTWMRLNEYSGFSNGFQWIGGSPVWSLLVPLWFPTILSAMTTAVAWHLDTLARRRVRLNLCPTGGCNYDRTGLAAGSVCPECGSRSEGQ